MINETLRLLRTFYGYKSIELSKKIGISQSYLSEIESGKKTPSLEILKKYSEIFKIKVSTLLFFSEEFEKDEKASIKNNVSKKMIKLLQLIEKAGALNEENI